jgi:1-deoxy-D-xylulose-5-phosphate synthase
MVDQKYAAEVVRLGIPDEYMHHGTQEELWADCGFDAASIAKTIKKMLFIEDRSNILSQNAV